MHTDAAAGRGPSRPLSRRRLLTVGGSALSVAALATLAACSQQEASGADAGASAAADNASKAATDSFPITLTHRFGSTTIPSEPSRIVALGALEADAVLALGVVPVGVVSFSAGSPRTGEASPSPSGREAGQDAIPSAVPTNAAVPGPVPLEPTLPWTDAALAALGLTAGSASALHVLGRPGMRLDEASLRAIAELRPDLILAVTVDLTQAQYRDLTALAPTLAAPAKQEADTPAWEAATTAVGAALGRSAAAEALVRQTSTQVARACARYPQLAGADFAVVRVLPTTDTGEVAGARSCSADDSPTPSPAATASAAPGAAGSQAHVSVLTSADPSAAFLSLLGLHPVDAVEDLAAASAGSRRAKQPAAPVPQALPLPDGDVSALDAALVWVWADQPALLASASAPCAVVDLDEPTAQPTAQPSSPSPSPTASASASVLGAPDAAVVQALGEDPDLSGLSALADHRALVLTSALVAAAVRACSPLSLPWLCEHYLPRLAQATQGRQVRASQTPSPSAAPRR